MGEGGGVVPGVVGERRARVKELLKTSLSQLLGITLSTRLSSSAGGLKEWEGKCCMT